MSLNVQFMTMAAMALSGAGLGLLFDVYRVLSGEFRFPRWLIPPLDLLYWGIGTIAVFRILFLINGGEVRLYVFLALLLGVVIYLWMLSGLAVRILSIILNGIKWLIQFTLKLGNVFLIRPIIGIYRILLVFLGILLTVSIFLGKVMIQLLYPLWKLLVWVSLPAIRGLHRAIRADRWLTPVADRISGWIQRFRNRN